jgi:hypothetical protein
LAYVTVTAVDEKGYAVLNYTGEITMHGYAQDYGIGRVGNGLGQVSAGIVINNIVKIAISRGFGPSQTYIDSATNVTTIVNNFKAWSIGVSYQSSSSKQ